jgi:hypothetical protein
MHELGLSLGFAGREPEFRIQFRLLIGLIVRELVC